MCARQCDAELDSPAAKLRREASSRQALGSGFKRNFSVVSKSPGRLGGEGAATAAAIAAATSGATAGAGAGLAGDDAPLSAVQRRRLQVEAQERVFRLERELEDARRGRELLNKASYDAQNDTVNI
jgi:hypothetical protein